MKARILFTLVLLSFVLSSLGAGFAPTGYMATLMNTTNAGGRGITSDAALAAVVAPYIPTGSNGNLVGPIVGQITVTNSSDSNLRMPFYNTNGFIFGYLNNGVTSPNAMLIESNNASIVRFLPQETWWGVYVNGGSPYLDQAVHASHFDGSGGTLRDLPPAEHALDAAMPTPFLGWNSILDANSYGGFPINVPSGAAMTNVINTWSTNGLLAAGYKVIWFDDLWQSNALALNGNGIYVMQQNPTYFPDTMQHYTAYAHSHGFKVGIYTSSGNLACSGLPATPFESIGPQAQLFNDWGIDYVKVDICPSGTPAQTTEQLTDRAYKRAWADAIIQMGWHNSNTNKMALLDTVLFENTGEIQSPEQASEMNVLENGGPGGYPANAIITDMPSVMTIALSRIRNNWAQRPGHWLELSSGGEGGSRNYSTNTWAAYMTMNALMSSPLYTAIVNGTYTGAAGGPGYSLPYLTNQAMLYVRTNTYTPCVMTFSNNLEEVWLKPIFDTGGNPASAVALVNLSSSPMTVGVNFDLSAGQVIPSQSTNRWVIVHDVWANTNSPAFFAATGNDSYSMIVAPTNVAFLIITNYFPANDYTHNGSGIYKAGPNTIGNGYVYIGDSSKTDHPQVVDSSGTLTLSANATQWNNQVNSTAIAALIGGSPMSRLDMEGNVISNVLNIYGSIASGTNGQPYGGMLKQLLPPTMPIINVGTFEDANVFNDPRWATNYTSLNIAYCSEQWVSNYMVILNRTGLAGLGMKLITLGDGQYAQTRDANGNLQLNPGFFPNGGPFLNAMCRTNGVYLSSYISMGDVTCMTQPGSGDPLGILYPNNIARDTIWNYFQGFYGEYIDACGTSAILADTNMAPIRIRAALRIAQEAALAAQMFDLESNKTWHPFYLAGPTANVGSGDGSHNFNWPVPDMLTGSSTSFGLAPDFTSGTNFAGTISNCVLELKRYMNFGFAASPGHSLFMDGINATANPVNDDTRNNGISQMAMLPSQFEVGRVNTYIDGLQNSLFFSILTNAAMVPCYEAYSNNLAEIFVRPLGGTSGPVGASNLVEIANSGNSGPVTVSVSNSMFLNTPYYAPMVAWDMYHHKAISNYYGSFSVTVGPTNKIFAYVFPRNLMDSSINGGTNMPPPQAFPPNSFVQWNSNQTVFALESDQSGAAWLSTNVAFAPVTNFDMSQVAGLALRYDVLADRWQQYERVNVVHDRGPYGFDLMRDGFGAPVATNYPGFFGGSAYAEFEALNNDSLGLPSGNGTFHGALWTNFPVPLNPPYLIYYTFSPHHLGNSYYMVDGATGNNGQFYYNGDSTPQLVFQADATLNIQATLRQYDTPMCVEILNTNSVNSFMKTNNPLTGLPVMAVTGNAGAYGLNGIVIGGRQANNGPWSNMGFINCVVFTNAQNIVGTAAETNIMLQCLGITKNH